MALFQLDEPDPCHDCALGGVDVSLQREEELLDYSGSGSIYECGFHDLLLLRTGVSGRFRSDHNRGLSGRNSSCGTFLNPLLESDKEAFLRRKRSTGLRERGIVSQECSGINFV